MGVTALSLFIIRNEIKEVKRLLNPRYPFVWFIIFFLVHIVGLINTENIDFAVADIGMKVSLIGVPLFLILTKIRIRTEDLIRGYLAALLIALAYCYAFAIYRSFSAPEDNHWAYFTESYFSAFMHRSYFATYLALGSLMAVYKFFEAKKGRIYYFLIGFVMMVSTILTFSKAGILIIVVLMIPLVFYLIAKHYGKLSAFVAIGLMITSLTLAFSLSDKLSGRFKYMISGFENHQATSNTSVESSAARMIMWSTSMQVFSENLSIGVGTGDVRDALDRRNTELGNLGVVEHSLNSHNQYLNTGVQLGLMGLIPLILMMLTALGVAIRDHNMILVLMVLTFSMTMLFESFLETQAGLIPVTLFILLFSLQALKSKQQDALKESKNM